MRDSSRLEVAAGRMRAGVEDENNQTKTTHCLTFTTTTRDSKPARCIQNENLYRLTNFLHLMPFQEIIYLADFKN